MSQQQFDMVIVGGGMAGAALALACSELPIRIALLEAQSVREGWPPLEESVLDYDGRVSAITEASRQLLETLGVWSEIQSRRSCAYTDMDVWDGEGTGRIHFSASEVNREQLGHIVENRLITAALMNRLREQGRVQCLFGQPLVGLTEQGDGAVLSLEDGRQLRADLVVAADGANSRIREWAGFATREWDYRHRAIVTTVETTKPHHNTAWQRFLPEGPLAFLPLPDAANRRVYCSIVWSAQPDFAEQLMGLSEAEFNQALARHFEARLGSVVASGKRICFPLRQRHAVDYCRGRVVLVGDAAHTIHPLAGQGINLGFADVQALADELARVLAKGGSCFDADMLGRYQRRRKGDNLAMMAAMEGFQNLFESSLMPLKIMRNVGMRALNTLTPVKRQLISKAMGL
ncbi:UbiH/UbiF/VisC/COQ6 family ubiquinone biosynthesis hydroxylase [Spongiibacter sp. KMU-158]|uniref:UbiH/UbiF/VisC/COQ6 family ubiquinone biosynthesis hydroxylase n=1 Tax=Spongiibacter pelagi TaxID=2760804 RepID=A0A927C1E4_9GAMM|nr:UbiH/UbiF/VisC/COQ6 family ubiquinone biosynthesis hydroxylase [Spongiibacter pelagi]MBD2857876.1 UbiH/UbiF/VisC/COQ6 family ubiquinone biosynthesis hydroxylase [Spongiibacter pelagi]